MPRRPEGVVGLGLPGRCESWQGEGHSEQLLEAGQRVEHQKEVLVVVL